MKTIISIDPGQSTGLIVGTYSETEPFRVTHAFQIEGGVEGFLKTVSAHHGEDWGMNLYGSLWVGMKAFSLYWDEETPLHDPEVDCEDDCPCYETARTESTVLTEKFSARGAAAGPFALRTEALEPLRVEGALLALGVSPIWCSPPQQYFLTGESKADKLKKRNAWLKEHRDLGYYITGRDVGCKVAKDARSALAHAIAWLRREKHKPTISLFRKGEND